MLLIFFAIKWFVGPLIILALLGIIFLSWLYFSGQWDRQAELANFLKQNNDCLIEENIRVKAEMGGDTQYCITNWTVCDLFVFREGIVLRGRMNSNSFYDCAFIFTNKKGSSLFRGCAIEGEYKTPVINKNMLRFSLILSQVPFKFLRGTDVRIDLFPNEKTIEILKQRNLL